MGRIWRPFLWSGWPVCRGRMDAQERRCPHDRYVAGAWTRRSDDVQWTGR